MNPGVRQIVGRVLTLGLVLGLLEISSASNLSAAPAGPRLAKNRDAFFVENDFVYHRFLQLARDGSYRQITREPTTAAEVDRGTWTQDADGTVLLHYTYGGLRFRALLGGPLSITLDDPQKFGRLPLAASAIRRWLVGSPNAVFAADTLSELALPPAVVTLDPAAESFSRADLESLAAQIDEFTWSEQHQTCRLSLTKPAGSPPLLIQHGAVFNLQDLPRVRQEYRVSRGQAPPFYFVQVDAGTFAREAGSWQKLP